MIKITQVCPIFLTASNILYFMQAMKTASVFQFVTLKSTKREKQFGIWSLLEIEPFIHQIKQSI